MPMFTDLFEYSDGEVWKNIEGYFGKYQVSSLGRVKRTPHIVDFNSKNQTKVFRCSKSYPEKVWNTFPKRRGYSYLTLTFEGTKIKKSVHRLVAEAFLPNPYNLPEVNHIDGDKSNNRLENLEWITSKENQIHAVKVLNKGRGESHGCAKCTDETIQKIKKLYQDGLSRKTLKELFNLSKSQIARIVTNNAWKHLKGN